MPKHPRPKPPRRIKTEAPKENPKIGINKKLILATAVVALIIVIAIFVL